ncbi:MAG: uroporphyrinogen decarboxylase family protein [Clostridiales Family XIII bacterium]|jgi:uroporphyrinogen decarboxylase|nr:uroporphyrinogen decarboxylase family protein [Clostridiales Family XIII bacterium]
MTTPNENVRDAFLGKKPARIPVGVCLGGSWPFFVENVTLRDLLTDPIKTAEIFYRVNERVDADFITVGTGATALLIESLGGEVTFTDNGAPVISSLLVSSVSDLEALDIEAAMKTERMAWLKAVATETVRINNGHRSIFVSGRAPFTLASQIMGLEVFSKALIKNPSLAAKLLEFTTRLSIAYFEFMLEVPGIDGIFIADPSASGDVVSTRHFERFVLPYLTSVVQRLSAYNKLSLVHICGDITNRLHLLPQTGMQMISVDSKVDLKTAKEILDGRIGLSGNVNPVAVLEDLSPDEVYQVSKQCLKDGAADGGFMLLPGCDISAHVSEANVKAMVDVAHEFTHEWNVS